MRFKVYVAAATYLLLGSQTAQAGPIRRAYNVYVWRLSCVGRCVVELETNRCVESPVTRQLLRQACLTQIGMMEEETGVAGDIVCRETDFEL